MASDLGYAQTQPVLCLYALPVLLSASCYTYRYCPVHCITFCTSENIIYICLIVLLVPVLHTFNVPVVIVLYITLHSVRVNICVFVRWVPDTQNIVR